MEIGNNQNTATFEDLFDFSAEPLDVIPSEVATAHINIPSRRRRHLTPASTTTTTPSTADGSPHHLLQAFIASATVASSSAASSSADLTELSRSAPPVRTDWSALSEARSNNGSLGFATDDLGLDFGQRQQLPSAAGLAGKSRRGRKPGQRNLKTDMKSKLERSRQSARECRARKKLRYQYLDDLILEREKANLALKEELLKYQRWCHELDKGRMPDGLADMLQKDTIEKQRQQGDGCTGQD